MNSSKYPSRRPAGREHIPVYPKGFIALRIVQLVLAVIILGLSAFSLTSIIFSGNSLTTFTSVATLIIMCYYIIAEFGPPAIYNYWAVLALDIFGLVFWIASFALLASQVAGGDCYYCDYYDCYSCFDSTVAACLYTAAGLGGVEFALFIVGLAMHAVMMHRHRSAGLHNRPVDHHLDNTGAFPAAGPVQAEKAQPTQTVAPHMQYPGFNQTPTATPSPAQGQHMYQPPAAPGPGSIVQPAPFYPQQQQQGHMLQQQQQQQQQAVPGSFGTNQTMAPHAGSFEAQSQPVGQPFGQAQYQPGD